MTQTWRLWPFFLLHLSSGLSGAFFSCLPLSSPNSAEQKSTIHLSVNSLEGSLTTLLIAHLATLQSGRQLEFYVTLLGVFLLRVIKFCFAFRNGNKFHFVSPFPFSIHSNARGLPTSSVGHLGWAPPTGFWISPTPPGHRRPHPPHLACDHLRSAVTALPPCFQVPFRHSDLHLISNN